MSQKQDHSVLCYVQVSYENLLSILVAKRQSYLESLMAMKKQILETERMIADAENRLEEFRRLRKELGE